MCLIMPSAGFMPNASSTACFPLNDDHVKSVEGVREQIWQLYHDLKAYKLALTSAQAEDIKSRFQTLCSTPTAYAILNQASKRLGNNQHELLRVLDKPYLLLHNNLSEQDIRDYIKKRKISGSTRSNEGEDVETPLPA